MVPDRHGATAWKRWIFCSTDYLDFENLENRRWYHNPGKPRTAGLCGRAAGVYHGGPLSSTFFGWPKLPDLPPENRCCGTASRAVFPLDIPPQNVLVNLRPHRPHTARNLLSVPGAAPSAEASHSSSQAATIG